MPFLIIGGIALLVGYQWGKGSQAALVQAAIAAGLTNSSSGTADTSPSPAKQASPPATPTTGTMEGE